MAKLLVDAEAAEEIRAETARDLERAYAATGVQDWEWKPEDIAQTKRWLRALTPAPDGDAVVFPEEANHLMLAVLQGRAKRTDDLFAELDALRAERDAALKRAAEARADFEVLLNRANERCDERDAAIAERDRLFDEATHLGAALLRLTEAAREIAEWPNQPCLDPPDRKRLLGALAQVDEARRVIAAGRAVGVGEGEGRICIKCGEGVSLSEEDVEAWAAREVCSAVPVSDSEARCGLLRDHDGDHKAVAVLRWPRSGS